MASGIVPSSFRILRQLLARVEDADSGRILVDELHAPIPADRLQQARATAGTLGATVHGKLPLLDGMSPMSRTTAELLLNSTWRPTLSVTGVDGIPPLPSAGNVLRPIRAFVLSFRLPPGVDPERAALAIKQALEHDPPYGARVSSMSNRAWAAGTRRRHAPWLRTAIQDASREFFGADAMYMGTGGSIPFMADAEREIPARAVHRDRRVGPAVERARSERIPRYRDGQARDSVRGVYRRRACAARAVSGANK